MKLIKMKLSKYFQLIVISMITISFVFANTGTSDNYTITTEIGSYGSEHKITNSPISAVGSSDSFLFFISGGNPNFCVENWSVGNWTTCSGSTQTRTVTDSNNCGTEFFKPSTTQSCTESVVEEDDDETTDTSSSTSTTTTTNDNNDELTPAQTTTQTDTQEEKVVGKVIIKAENNITENFSINVDFSENLNQTFEGNKTIQIRDKEKNIAIIEFEIDFSSTSLNLSNLNINKGKKEERNYIIVNGIDLENKTKAIRLTKENNLNGICIKDMQINSINEISENCRGENEFTIICNGIESNGYRCVEETSYLRVFGLRHSAVLEFEVIEEEITPTNEQTPTVSSILEANEIRTQQENTQEDEVIIGEVEKNLGLLTIISIIIFVAIVIGISILLVLNKKKNKYEKSNYKPENNTNQSYTQIKNYFETYKDKYPKEDLKNQLIKEGFSTEEINRVMEEVYNK